MPRAPRSRWSGALLASLAAAVVLASFTAWAPLVTDAGPRLLIPLTVIAATVVGTGVLLRGLRTPIPVILTAQLGVAGTVLAADWAPRSTTLGVPTPATVERAVQLLTRAVEESRTFAAPVPAEATAFPLLALSLGVVAVLLCDLLAVSLARPSFVALPALVVVTVPVVVLTEPLPEPTTVATAAAYALLLAVQHAADLSAWARSAERARGVWGPAAAISLGALTAALVLTPVLPSRDGGVRVPGGGQATDIDLRNPIADLQRDLRQASGQTVLSITTSGREPSYVRTTVLDVYDGRRWRPGERDLPVGNAVDGPLRSPRGLPSDSSWQTQDWQLEAQGLYSPWLPLPFPARSAVAEPGFFYDDATLDAYNIEERTVAGTTWSAVALLPEWSSAVLRSAADPTAQTELRWTALPDDFPPAVAALAREVAPPRTSAYDQAVALQRWFRSGGGFRYSLEEATAGTDENSLVAFLEPDGRVGYCEQFSASMAVMARSLGIPARVAVGFLRGDSVPTVDGRGDRWDFSGRDLHAWPELYFPGSGWVRFEPTPAVQTGQAPSWTQGAGRNAPDTTPSAAPTAAAPEAPRAAEATPTPQAEEPTATGEDGVRPAQQLADWVRAHLRGLLAFALLTIVLAGLGVPAWVRTRRRRTRCSAAGHGDLEAAWAELLDHARDLGVATDPDASVRRNAEILHRSMGVPLAARVLVGEPQVTASPATVAGAVHHLAQRLEQERYAPAALQPAGATAKPEASAQEDPALMALVTAARELTERATPSQHRRARWWPSSVL